MQNHNGQIPIPITPGMHVVEIVDLKPAEIVGITQAYCVYRTGGDHLAVRPWREMALCNVCPAKPLPPADVIDHDKRNASAAVLRELLLLTQFGLTDRQRATLEELVAQLCDDPELQFRRD